MMTSTPTTIYAGRPALFRHRVRRGRRHVFYRLFCVRGAVESPDDARRRPPVDRPHHDQLGRDLVGHDVHQQRDHVLRAALFIGRGRGGLFPRHHPVPDVLVPRAPARAHGGAVHEWRGDCRRGGRSAVGLDHDSVRRCARPGRLAMAVAERGRQARADGGHRAGPGRPATPVAESSADPWQGVAAGADLLPVRDGLVRRELLAAAADQEQRRGGRVPHRPAHRHPVLRGGRDDGAGRAPFGPHGRAALAHGVRRPGRRAGPGNRHGLQRQHGDRAGRAERGHGRYFDHVPDLLELAHIHAGRRGSGGRDCHDQLHRQPGRLCQPLPGGSDQGRHCQHGKRHVPAGRQPGGGGGAGGGRAFRALRYATVTIAASYSSPGHGRLFRVRGIVALSRAARPGGRDRRTQRRARAAGRRQPHVRPVAHVRGQAGAGRHPAACQFRGLPPLFASVQAGRGGDRAADRGSRHRRDFHRPHRRRRRDGRAGRAHQAGRVRRHRADLLDRHHAQQAAVENLLGLEQAQRHHHPRLRRHTGTHLAAQRAQGQRHRSQGHGQAGGAGHRDHRPAGAGRCRDAAGLLRCALRRLAGTGRARHGPARGGQPRARQVDEPRNHVRARSPCAPGPRHAVRHPGHAVRPAGGRPQAQGLREPHHQHQAALRRFPDRQPQRHRARSGGRRGRHPAGGARVPETRAAATQAAPARRARQHAGSAGRCHPPAAAGTGRPVRLTPSPIGEGTVAFTRPYFGASHAPA
uniref:Uncharacterized protein n=1 Tax=Tanacetum cinerariifolium TaxID=118510 RepID=A0A699GM47_TANCI|nr:hypothetical protein [Tanacetum cinerariifolium]